MGIMNLEEMEERASVLASEIEASEEEIRAMEEELQALYKAIDAGRVQPS